MELYIGGYAQNKLEYVKNQYSSKKLYEKLDINTDNSVYPDSKNDIFVLNNLHLLIKSCLLQGMTKDQIEEKIFELQSHLENSVDSQKKLVIICDEIGSGIIPLDEKDRQWREVTGRILCRIAEKSEKVVRIVCGLGQVIKS